jgi:hypothetical protein
MKHQVVDNDENVICPICKKELSIRSGWLDKYVVGVKGPYNLRKPYVHFRCLSEKRKKEIATICSV